jgi:lipoprotein NlpD
VYVVKRGDTLYSIAWRHRLDYHLVAAWNRIKGPEYRIYPGQQIRLRPPPLTPPRKNTTAVQAKPKTPVVSQAPVVIKPSKPRAQPTDEVKRQTQVAVTTKRDTATRAPQGRLKLDWRWPTIGKVVQTFSAEDPERKGVRISGRSGQPVVAIEAGRVVYSGSGLVGYGNLVIIKHDNQYLSAYGYNKKLLVQEGDKVARGEQIAQMGSPRNGAESMLHFEIRKEGKPIDPLPLLPAR